MSQTVTYALVKECGRATTGQLRQLAQQRYPDSTLYLYISQRLAQLRKSRTIDRDQAGFWYVVEGSEDWDRFEP